MVGELLGALVEVAVDGGSEVIHKRYGWRGCLAVLLVIIVLIGLLIWVVV